MLRREHQLEAERLQESFLDAVACFHATHGRGNPALADQLGVRAHALHHDLPTPISFSRQLLTFRGVPPSDPTFFADILALEELLTGLGCQVKQRLATIRATHQDPARAPWPISVPVTNPTRSDQRLRLLVKPLGIRDLTWETVRYHWTFLVEAFPVIAGKQQEGHLPVLAHCDPAAFDTLEDCLRDLWRGTVLQRIPDLDPSWHDWSQPPNLVACMPLVADGVLLRAAVGG
jgi:hypothetical protein